MNALTAAVMPHLADLAAQPAQPTLPIGYGAFARIGRHSPQQGMRQMKSLLCACALFVSTSFSMSAQAIVDPTTQPPACTCSKAAKKEKAVCPKEEVCDCKSDKPKCVKK